MWLRIVKNDVVGVDDLLSSYLLQTTVLSPTAEGIYWQLTLSSPQSLALG